MSSSEFDTLYADLAWPILDQLYQIEVTQYPLGVAANAQTVNAIWTELDPRADNYAGKSVIRRGELKLLIANSVDAKDRWVINSENWYTVDLGRDPIYHILTLERKDVETSVRAGRM